MPTTNTGTATCDCGYAFRYMDIYNGHAWTQCTDERGNLLPQYPGCGQLFNLGGYTVKSDKPPHSPLAGYVAREEWICTRN